MGRYENSCVITSKYRERVKNILAGGGVVVFNEILSSCLEVIKDGLFIG